MFVFFIVLFVAALITGVILTALGWYRMSAEDTEDFDAAQYQTQSEQAKPSRTDPVAHLRRKAEEGDARSQFEYGLHLVRQSEMYPPRDPNREKAYSFGATWIKMAAKQSYGPAPVSYTHLDVYKRQVIGIGGSYLGAQAALDFIKSQNYNLLKKSTPDIYFIGNGLSADSLNETLALVGDRDFSVNVISKSGTTTEPAIAFRIFRELLERKYGRGGAASRIYATTDARRGVLHEMAVQEEYTIFIIPDDVGGRYSVFTPVGLLPLAVAGVDSVSYTHLDVYKRQVFHSF